MYADFSHLVHVYTKVDARSRTELAAAATRRGIETARVDRSGIEVVQPTHYPTLDGVDRARHGGPQPRADGQGGAMRRRVLEGILVAATALTWAARSDATFPIFGCCRNISAFGFDICANTGPVDCPAPGTFEIGRLCDGQTAHCVDVNPPPFIRAFDRKSLTPMFNFLAGNIVQRARPGETVYRRIGVCNETGVKLNYHTVWTSSDSGPEFFNRFFALPSGVCTSTDDLQAIAEVSALKISKWCASVEPMAAEQCPPPHRPGAAASASQAEGGQTAGVGVAVFSNTALSILGVPSAGAPALGEAALVALSLALAALGVTAARQRR